MNAALVAKHGRDLNYPSCLQALIEMTAQRGAQLASFWDELEQSWVLLKETDRYSAYSRGTTDSLAHGTRDKP